MTDALRDLREALQEFVMWDDEHEGIYSEHNPEVRGMIRAARAALNPTEASLPEEGKP